MMQVTETVGSLNCNVVSAPSTKNNSEFRMQFISVFSYESTVD